MDIYTLLIKLHQIQTSAIQEGNVELRDFIADIFNQLTDEETEMYLEKLDAHIAVIREIKR